MTAQVVKAKVNPVNNDNNNDNSNNSNNNNKTSSPSHVCLGRNFVGDDFNRVLQLTILLDENDKVAINRKWAGWHREFFGGRPVRHGIKVFQLADICRQLVRPESLIDRYPFANGLPRLEHMIPSERIRQEAQDAVAELLQQDQHNATTFISVHRRSMNRGGQAECDRIAREGNARYCVGPHTSLADVDYAGYCTITYDKVLEDVRRQWTSNDPLPPIVLFTDGLIPELDETFPLVDNHTYHVQTWMMTLSSIHYGNPMSSMDYVLAHWRQGRNMRPSSCYRGYNQTVRRDLSSSELRDKWKKGSS